MRICIIGNSHLAAVKHGWDLTETGSALPTFLGAPGGRLNALTVTDGVLKGPEGLSRIMLNTTGVSEAALDNFDAVVIVGLRFTVNHCARLFATHRTWRPGPADPSGTFLTSREALVEATRGQLQRTIAIRIARRIRAARSIPILIAPQAGPSERILEDDADETEVWRQIHAAEREDEIREIHDEACQAFATNFEIVEQPPETIVNEIFSKREYDSPKYKTNGDPLRRQRVDPFHMNVEYGRLVVPELLSRVAGRALA